MFRELARELIRVFRRGVDAPLPDERFDELAGRVFRHQFEENPVYAGFCRGRGIDPGVGPHWTEIPPVPTRAFKNLRLFSGPEEEVEIVFRTSGTSAGPDERGEHHVRDLALYRESLLPNFRTHLLPDDARLPLVSLIPPPGLAPDSSLSCMTGVVDRDLTRPGGGYFVDPDGGLDEGGLEAALMRFQREERPVLIMATAFALVHWMDAMDREGLRFRLPAGSRIMETGGFKGRSRTVEPDDLYAGLEERLGIPAGLIVNEYGMTELLSQFYEPTLRAAIEESDPESIGGGRPGGAGSAAAAPAPPSARVHIPPPWVRTRVLDPETLEPVSAGERGLLCHLDLANLGSVSAILTEDLGIRVGDGFRVLGRAEEAEPRGCSLAMDELLSAVPEP